MGPMTITWPNENRNMISEANHMVRFKLMPFHLAKLEILSLENVPKIHLSVGSKLVLL